MKILPPINLETLLVSLVGNTVSDFWSKHHLGTVHVVIHHIFKDWLKSFLVDEIEEDLFIGCNLNPDISFDIVDEASSFNNFVLLPLHGLSVIIPYLFEEKDVTGASGNQCLVVNQVHLSKVHFSHSFLLMLPFTRILIFYHYFNAMTLTIEWINFMFLFVIEAFVWEIFLWAIKYELLNFSLNLFGLDIINKVAMLKLEIVEKINKDSVVVYETAGNIWIWKSGYCHCPIIITDEFIDIKFILCNFLLTPRFGSESSQFKVSIIKIDYGKLVTFRILLYLL